MAVENYYAMPIATLSDWVKNPVSGFQPTRSKTNRTL